MREQITSLINGLILKKYKKILRVKNRKTNIKINLVKAWTMFIVVCVHCSGGGITHFMSNWINPAYYFMPLFVVASGYFYKDENDSQSIRVFLLGKFRALVIPYFTWNIFYGILNYVLRRRGIIHYGDQINLKSMFVRPWIDGHQFHFNIASWFLLSLFLVIVTSFTVRKIFLKLNLLNEWLLLVLFGGISMCAICLAEKGYNQGIWLCLTRMGFLLPYFQLGFLYKKSEMWFTKRKGGVISGLIILLYGMLALCNKTSVNVVFARFEGNSLVITVITVSCIILIMLAMEIFSPSFENNKIVRYIGDNTFTIMMHHPLYIFVLNFGLFMIGKRIDMASFDVEKFQTTIWYCYTWRDDRIKLFYVVFALGMPLIVKYLSDRVVIKLYNKNKKSND